MAFMSNHSKKIEKTKIKQQFIAQLYQLLSLRNVCNTVFGWVFYKLKFQTFQKKKKFEGKI